MNKRSRPTQLRVPIACLLLLTLASVPTANAADNAFPGIEKLMTEQEFSDAGLGQLNPAQRAALNQWLIRYTAGEAEFVAETEEVKEVAKDPVVTGRLNDEFNGWSGKTLFYLENGQVWKQRLSGRYHYNGASPEVEFTKNLLGYWSMTVLETGMSVGVKRVR
jgi:hypothetical protein